MRDHVFRVRALAPEFVSEIRSSRRDRRGQPVSVRFDAGRHQCRACLRLTEPGERHLLLSYSPFASEHPYAETGSIFIHERACEPYGSETGYPPEFPRHEVVLRAYNAAEEIEDAVRVGPRAVEDAIAELFANERVAHIHARNSEYGCFMFRIERA